MADPVPDFPVRATVLRIPYLDPVFGVAAVAVVAHRAPPWRRDSHSEFHLHLSTLSRKYDIHWVCAALPGATRPVDATARPHHVVPGMRRRRRDQPDPPRCVHHRLGRALAAWAWRGLAVKDAAGRDELGQSQVGAKANRSFLDSYLEAIRKLCFGLDFPGNRAV